MTVVVNTRQDFTIENFRRGAGNRVPFGRAGRRGGDGPGERDRRPVG